MRRIAALLAASLLTLVFSTGVAAAHAKLESMTPADGSTMAAPPKSVVLTFNEPVGSTGAEVVVKSASGASYSNGSPEVVDNTVTQQLNVLTEAGRYQIDVRIVSADGHPITASGSFTVTHAGHAVDQPAAPAANTPASGSSTTVVMGTMVLVMLVVVALAVVIVRRRPTPDSK